MNIHQSIGTAVSALVLTLAALPAARAQFGAVGANLPQKDFTWNWGNLERPTAHKFPDFDVTGDDGGFHCSLEGKLRLSSNWSRTDIRQMEEDLRTSLFFIQNAANTMNSLDLRRELDWATLDCEKPEPTEANLEKQQESLDRAKEKAVRKLIERREKREREEAEARAESE